MSIIDNINQLFKRDSVSTNINTNRQNKVLKSRITLNELDYDTGELIMRDTQVNTGYNILKYLLSSKQWILVANPNDESNTVYDFIL